MAFSIPDKVTVESEVPVRLTDAPNFLFTTTSSGSLSRLSVERIQSLGISDHFAQADSHVLDEQERSFWARSE
jgi:hypothetical protein